MLGYLTMGCHDYVKLKKLNDKVIKNISGTNIRLNFFQITNVNFKESTVSYCQFLKVNMNDLKEVGEEVTDGLVVRAGVSVTWTVLSWSGGQSHWWPSGYSRRFSYMTCTVMIRSWGAWYFCPKSYLHQKYQTMKWGVHLVIIYYSYLTTAYQLLILLYHPTGSTIYISKEFNGQDFNLVQ